MLLLATADAAHADVTINRATTFQTFDGWEVTGYAAQDHAAFANFRDAVMTMAASDLGITRIRLEVRAGVENSVDYYQQREAGTIDAATWRGRRYTNVNDNNDPNLIDPAGFHFTELDQHIQEIVLPLKAAVEAAGGQLAINLCYVAFTGQNAMGTTYIHDQAAEYAELVVATYQHLQTTHGFVPDMWEMILEPDNTTQWSGTVIGYAIVASAARLQTLGYTPRFMAPSNTNMSAAVTYFDALAAVPGAIDHVDTLVYHRYGGVGTNVAQTMAARAQQHGIKTAMLEWIGASVDQLHEDLKVAGNSSWQQFTIASVGGTDDGGSYLKVDATNPASPVVTLASRTKLLRQYMHFIRPGAVRIGATSDVGSFDPVAFVNANGTDVVVVKATAGGTFDIHGLATGTYNVVYSTNTQSAVDSGDTTITSGNALTVTIPQAGVITVWGRSTMITVDAGIADGGLSDSGTVGGGMDGGGGSSVDAGTAGTAGSEGTSGIGGVDGSGGVSGVGDAATAGSPGSDPTNDEGCQCSTLDTPALSSVLPMLLALGTLARRRRHKRSS